MSDDKTPKTAGIAPAQRGALAVLQFTMRTPTVETAEDVQAAAAEISTYHAPHGDQALRHGFLSTALANFITAIVMNTDSGPARSTAISRAREAKMWASAAIALEGK